VRTITFNEVLCQAAELAGRDRTGIPNDDATLLRGVLSSAVRRRWTAAPWRELIRVEERTVTGGTISRTETDKTTIGEVMNVYDLDFRDEASAAPVPWADFDTEICLLGWDDTATAWAEFWIENPSLLSMGENERNDYGLPERFGEMLALEGAGHLLRVDGRTQEGNELLQLAESRWTEEAAAAWQLRDGATRVEYRMP